MNQKVFIDTNVMVDLLAKREPFYDTAKQLFSLVEQGGENSNAIGCSLLVNYS